MGWSPTGQNITGNTFCYAQYKYIGYVYTTLVERSLKGDYVNNRITKVADYAFYNCENLASVSAPLATDIGSNAFSLCKALKKADFTSAVGIAAGAFLNCTVLDALILRGDSLVTLWNKNAFTGTKISSGEGYIYVHASLLENYKTAENWNEFTDQFRAIEEYTHEIGGQV